MMIPFDIVMGKEKKLRKKIVFDNQQDLTGGYALFGGSSIFSYFYRFDKNVLHNIYLWWITFLSNPMEDAKTKRVVQIKPLAIVCQ